MAMFGRVACGFAAGVIGAGQLAQLPGITVLVGLLLATGLALLFARWTGAALLFGAFYALTWLAIACNARLPTDAAGSVWAITGTVVGLPESDARRALFDLDLDTPDARLGALRRVRVSWYNAPAPPSAAHCRLDVRLQSVHGFANPGGFDAEAWALSRGVGATGYVRSTGDNQCVATTLSDGPWSMDRVRDQLRAMLRRTALPHSAELVALVLGDGQDIPARQWLVLQQTGTVHLIVISGLHITMIAAAAFAAGGLLMRACPWLLLRYGARTPAALLAAVLTLAYCALAGFSVPTMRALIMATCALGAAALQRRTDWRTGLALAIAAVHAWEPLAWREPGFWLSFISVGTLLYASSSSVASQQSRIVSWLSVWLRTQWLMLVVFTPLLLVIFGQGPLISPVANMIAEPLVSLVIVPIALVGTGLLSVGAPGALALLQLADHLVDAMWWYLQWLAPFGAATALHGAAAPLLLLLAGALGVAPNGFPGRRLLGVLVAVALAAQPTDVPPKGELRVEIFDVGQGTAVLIETARHRLLVDTGPVYGGDFEAGGAILAPALLRAGIGHLDRVVLSHADQDHTGGYAGLRARVPIGEVWEPYAPMVVGVMKPQRCIDGASWRWDGVDFLLLGPHAPLPMIENDRSCVVLVRSASGRKVLLPGDISRREEVRLLQAHGAALANLDVLIAAHHGSKTASMQEFVSATRPQLVVFSAGWRNRFGHPHADVVQRFGQVGSLMLRTGDVGGVVWNSWQAQVQAVRAERCITAKVWWPSPLSCPLAISATPLCRAGAAPGLVCQAR